MRQEIFGTKVLALYLRPQQLGFTVFKGPKQLLDWGRSTCRWNDGGPVLVCKRVSSLLKNYAPSVIVVRKLTKRERKRYGDIQPIVSVVRALAKKHSSKLALIGREEVRYAFRQFGKTTKYSIASQIAIFFPELTWKLPPPRKAWQREHHNMAIFDAASLGIAYFSRFVKFEMDVRSVEENFERPA